MPRNAANITLTQLAQTPAGKLPANAHLFADTNKKDKASKQGGKPGDKEKEWMHTELQFWCNKNLLELKKEYRFAPPRLFRFDWAIVNPVLKLKIAIEYEGIMLESKGHTSPKHYTKDTEKYRMASELGYHLMRYTVLNYQNVIKDLIDYMNRKEY